MMLLVPGEFRIKVLSSLGGSGVAGTSNLEVPGSPSGPVLLYSTTRFTLAMILVVWGAALVTSGREGGTGCERLVFFFDVICVVICFVSESN